MPEGTIKIDGTVYKFAVGGIVKKMHIENIDGKDVRVIDEFQPDILSLVRVKE